MVEVRRAGADDVPGLHRLAVDAYAVHLPRMAGARPAPMDADYAAAVAHDEVWVAESAGEVVGLLVLVPHADHVLLENVAVAPSWQGRGVGARLLALAEERATEHGLEVVRLFTHVTMVENQRRYERLGYVVEAREPTEGNARVFYVKHLR